MAAMLLCSISASAKVVQIDGIWYDLVKKAAKVTHPEDDTNLKYSGSVTIPSTIIYDGDTYKVISIGSRAFSNCSNLISIDIPESVTSIEDEAFYGCYGLTSIVIPESVTSIGEKAFAYCSNLASIVIPNSVTKIGLEAFAYCNGLTTIMIPENATSIGHSAFLGCTGELFFNTYIPYYTDYRYSMFYGSGFSKVVLGDNVTGIGDFAFYGCSSITSITIPESVTYFAPKSFEGCYGLTEIHINNLEAWCKISRSDSFSSAYNLYLNNELVTGLVIPDGVTGILGRAFEGCNSLTSVTIPSSVTSIGYDAFKGCSNLTSVIISEGVTRIEDSTFEDCCNLTFINIPEGVAEIEADVFSKCSKLTTIVLPKSLKRMNYRTFANCKELLDVYCYAENPPIAYDETFEYSYPEGMTLHVPSSAMGNYIITVPWSRFGLIESLGITINNLILSESSVTLMEGETLTLSITTTPTNADKNLIAWSSSNPEVASVGANGKVLAVSPGVTTITARTYDSSKLSVSCEVKVVAVPRYTITYTIDGEIFHTDTLIVGEKITLPKIPEREGYTFSGWSEIPATMPAEDVTISGYFTINKYLVTFMIDDEVIAADSVEYGASIVAPEAPEKDGYAFDGWSEIPETMPAHDVTVYGTFSKLVVETIAINDSDFSFSMEENTECGKITYTRTFSDTNWQALYIPFEIPITEEFLANFEVADINNVHQYDHDDDNVTDETVIEAFKMTSGTLEANYPFLIRAKEVGEKSIVVTGATLYTTEENSIDCSSVREKFTFTGTYNHMSSNALTPNEGYYTLNDGEWQPVTEGETLGAFRFYLKVDSRNNNAVTARTIRMRIVGDDGTNIEKPEFRSHDSEIIYDLQGRRVEKAAKGIYIIGGKKVIL